MNIIIPIGGKGERFKNDGYRFPKPLINIFGKPMILWVLDNLNIQDEDKIFIIYNEELDKYNFREIIKFRYKKHNQLNFINISYYTRGAAETILCGLNQLSPEDLESTTISLDCDTFYKTDIIKDCKDIGSNMIFYFNDQGDKPIYSYIKIQDNLVVEIKEKEKISSNANTGAYCFRTGKILKDYCQKLLSTHLGKDKKEYYVSCIYDLMLKDVESISTKYVDKDNFVCLGTPDQVQSFCLKDSCKPKRFCFDLDNTLVTYPVVEADYSSVEPIQSMIDYVRELKQAGHTIIIYTARRMKTHKGNVGAIVADVGKITMETLEKFDIPYDELYFGKPYADFYIDDLAANPYYDVQKELGFYKKVIEPRSFNSIQMNKEVVIKKSKNGEKLGEINWLEHAPILILDLFPRLISHNDAETEMVMERIDGVPVSLLYINGSMTMDIFNKIMMSMYRIHSCSACDPSEVSYQDFYSNKIKERFSSFDYSNFFENADGMEAFYSRLLMEMNEYEGSIRKHYGKVIHGDPVFTNILIDSKNDIKYIDMRHNIFGDPLYDYAKIYQSIIGYDFILNDKPMNDSYISEWKNIFENFIVKSFGQQSMNNIKLITKSLLFTLIPLHNNDKCQKYFELIGNI